MNRITSRFIFLVSACSFFVPKSFSQWVTPQANSALPVEVAQQLVVDIVGAFFLFDQLFTKSATAISPDYLNRISEPSSKFYPDYLEYKEGQISRAEVVRRLPHIAVLGDSLSKNMYISSIPSLFWRARTERRKNWFLDTDSAPESIYSVYERLEKFTPLVATEYSSSGAKVAPGQITPDLPRKLGRTRNFSGQVHQVLRSKKFPDLVITWIGHDNTNWAKIVSSTEREHPEKRLREIAQKFGENYTQQLRVLIDRAKTQNHKVSIVIFGLANLEQYFKAEQKAETLHASNRTLYPYIGSGSWMFESLKPAYQQNMTRLSLMMNSEIRAMSSNFNKELTDYPNVRVQYSDALSNVKIRLEMLHPKDAWHLSPIGHSVVAQTVCTAMAPSLHFLGIESQDSSRRSRLSH